MINFAIYETILGFIEIKYKEDTLIALQKINATTPSALGTKNSFTDLVYDQICEYLIGKRKHFTFDYALNGTTFQKSVWQELCNIPYGETRTYKDIAKAIGNEKACRAVGMANNKNPVALVVPCHRVIGSNQRLVGYAGGLAMKEFLLTIEKKNK